MKKLFFNLALTACICCVSCSKYSGKYISKTANSGDNKDVVFADMNWLSTADSSVYSIELSDLAKNFFPTDIISVTVNNKGYETKAGYMVWGRENKYWYEIVHNRIVLYWQTDGISDFAGAPPVTVVVRFK